MRELRDFFCEFVCVSMAESERGEKKRCDLEVICMEEWEIMHGSPMGNSEVAHLSQLSSNPLGLGYWAETWRKKRNLGLLLLSPIFELALGMFLV